MRTALAYEIERQAAALDSCGVVERQTLLWDAASGRASPMRSKEASRDYRYFREPDLPDYEVGEEWISSIREAMPELPDEAESRLVKRLGLRRYDARLLTRTPETLTFFELVLRDVCSACDGTSARTSPGRVETARTQPPDVGGVAAAALVANWVNVILPAVMREAGLEPAEASHTARPLAEMLTARLRGEVSDAAARTLLLEALRRDEAVARLIAELDLTIVNDISALRDAARVALAEHPELARRLAAGEERLRDFFIGLMMRETRGKADPEAVRSALEEELRGI